MTKWTQEAMEKRLVHYADLKGLRNAFIDARTPGSDRKENFTIIGPGVSENPAQVVHIPEPHGFNIGAARQPFGCTNSQHSHLTAETFVVHTGKWRFVFGPDKTDGYIDVEPGDVATVPTHMFRGFEKRVLGDAAKTDHRWRIEHAQVVAPEEFPRFAALGVIASMQPTHATSDMPWAQDRLGPVRITGAYAWQRLQDSSVKLALGSDFPVESVDPRRGLHAAVTRQDAHDHPAGGWRAEERLSASEALRGFTADAAWAAHDEATVGRLAPGLRADFVILDEDPLAIPGEQLDDLHVRSTWVDGKAVYEAE